MTHNFWYCCLFSCSEGKFCWVLGHIWKILFKHLLEKEKYVGSGKIAQAQPWNWCGSLYSLATLKNQSPLLLHFQPFTSAFQLLTVSPCYTTLIPLFSILAGLAWRCIKCFSKVQTGWIYNFLFFKKFVPVKGLLLPRSWHLFLGWCLDYFFWCSVR